ncbi:MAG: 3-deoxy-manno-octulosonate cytidylyltransferase [Gammaproteobacteria bacterium]|jgi:3-deoxy-manno-octulosonate cytidylyltransferase (CMP-KDO synthetase)|nr:3-deoxy-manno-octulosonate cytidylyltransferase [Gammaproteobacteria bacterium]
MTEFAVIIPARFASQRLPGKPLRDIAGKTLIQRTYESVTKSRASLVVVATDDRGIADTVQSFGGRVCMTDEHLQSGTDRVAQAAATLQLEDEMIVVNVQGDEPDMPGSLIDQVVDALEAHPEAQLATAACPLDTPAQYTDASVVKVVCDQNGIALYFSRSPIPHARADAHNKGERVPWQLARRHIGIYAYRASYLRAFSAADPSPLEQAEKLEQLRALSRGDRIVVADAKAIPSPGVDTLQDLEAAIKRFSQAR